MIGIKKQLEDLLAPVVQQEGMELVDLHYQREQSGWVLRLYIDKPQGVNLKDCELISNKVSDLLDTENIIPYSYNLEVSSPGVYRPLRKESDFLRFQGQEASIYLYAAQEGRKHFKGILKGFQEGTVLIQEDTKLFSFPLQEIAKANLEPKLEF